MSLSIDFETRSTVDLRRTSVYRYAEDDTTDIWCMAWAIEDRPVGLWTPGQVVPALVEDWVAAGKPLRAWNANFERILWRFILGPRYGFPVPKLEQWYCTQAEAAAQNLPLSLGKCAKVLGAAKKDAKGRRLMLQMHRPRRVEDDGTIVWWDTTEKLMRLYEYCKQDVRVEREIAKKIRRLDADERRCYLLDQRINDRGVLVDIDLAEAMADLQADELADANRRLREITDGDVTTVNQVGKLTEWADVPNVQKSTIDRILDNPEKYDDDVLTALEIRRDAGKSSTRKLDAIFRGVNSDNRARGMLQYHGAGTGRWAGRGIQPQNFPRPDWKHDEVLKFIPLILARDAEAIREVSGSSVMDVLSSTLRALFMAKPGSRLMGIDFSQIEARITDWLAGQEDALEDWSKKKPMRYEKMASKIYGIPVEEIDKDSFERQVGKGTVLGCGFQMGARKLSDQIYEVTGIRIPYRRSYDDPPEEADRIIDAYRTTNWRVKAFWDEIQDAAIAAVWNKGKVFACGRRNMIRYVVRSGVLWCVLPSGRALAYSKPSIQPRMTPWGEKKPSLTFVGIDGYTRKWKRQTLYGGWLTENVVQATARDLLRDAMFRCEDAGYKTVLTVHDEILLEVPEGFGSYEEAETLVCERPEWAFDLPVAVEGWEGERYRK